MATNIKQIAPNTLEITETNITQIPIDVFTAQYKDTIDQLTARVAQLIANRDSYDPLIAATQQEIDDITALLQSLKIDLSTIAVG